MFTVRSTVQLVAEEWCFIGFFTASKELAITIAVTTIRRLHWITIVVTTVGWLHQYITENENTEGLKISYWWKSDLVAYLLSTYQAVGLILKIPAMQDFSSSVTVVRCENCRPKFSILSYIWPWFSHIVFWSAHSLDTCTRSILPSRDWFLMFL